MKPYAGRLRVMTLGVTLAVGLSLWRAAQVNATPLACNTTVLQGVALADTTIVAAVAAPAGPIPGSLPHPAFCDVTGFVTTTNPGPNQVNFELALPDPTAWITKFLFFGNGGFAGSIQIPPVFGTAFGFAAAATDTGH